jgi:hypothetical protein
LITALTQNPELSEPLVRQVQDFSGAHRALDLINALSEAGVPIGVTVQKKELSEEEKQRRRDNLAKAREAKKAKANPNRKD